YVNDQYYFSRPTYAALLSLLDNYNHAVGSAEHTSAQESQEVTSFLDEISKTTVMQKAHDFLSQHGNELPIYRNECFNTTMNTIYSYGSLRTHVMGALTTVPVLSTCLSGKRTTKALGSFIYGTSPEFDIAMFTVCYLTHKNQHCNFSVDGHNMEVLTYEMTHGGGGHLGTGYVN
ncbi:ENDOU-like protein, partial [Mya arenaria]